MQLMMQLIIEVIHSVMDSLLYVLTLVVSYCSLGQPLSRDEADRYR